MSLILDGIDRKQGLAGRWAGAVPASLWFGAGLFVLLVAAGNHLLQDADTYWHIAVGQSILDQSAFPHHDVFSFTRPGAPWISSSWLSQLLFALAHRAAGWSGPVVLAALSIAAAFALLVSRLNRSFAPGYAIVVAAAAVAVSTDHLLARPHVLVMPVMIAWVAGLLSASDERRAPSFMLLPLLTLWANLHGSFVFGIAIVFPIALDALWTANATERKSLALNWAAFALCAVIAGCLTPYGWDALLASHRILDLGGALALIPEWKPVDFSRLGAFELCLLASIGAVLARGVTLPPTRILLLLGLLHMALSHVRNVEVLALLAPLVVARPLAQQFGLAVPIADTAGPRWMASAAMLLATCVAAAAIASGSRYDPMPAQTPVAAVEILKQRKIARVLHNPGFGGYMITAGLPVFMDGRAELYGEAFVVDTLQALSLQNPGKLTALLDEHRIEATLLRRGTPAIGLMQRLAGWEQISADDTAVLHVRSVARPRAEVRP